ncbi:radical SAM/SPASM domain-containing protein [Clostridium aminobutyricum]|uniref:Radical SAM protein n=1 Tax=Clostridium aminobutyricum TaxID=33953 RepID=A0A939DA60_CLOAM|nr:radical SAM protein [Clostridium aminobutyricum]MBN7774046.1 radical SAM protein [Clostridium aminobutyricum]
MFNNVAPNGTKLCEFLYLATTRCNCRCSHCISDLYTGKENEMSSETFIKIYENSVVLPYNSVSVAGGEPFLKDDLDEYILYLEKKEIPCVISTNGYFVDRIERLIQRLKRKDIVRFAVSIDGNEQTHDTIRRCLGAYSRALESAIKIKESGCKVHINTVVQKSNINQISTLKDLFESKAIEYSFIPKILGEGEPFEFEDIDIAKVIDYVRHPRERKYLLSKGNFIIKNCHAGINSWLIDSNGDFYACYGGFYSKEPKDYRVGSILNGFDQVYNSAKKYEVCEKVVANCKGCLLPRDAEREVDHFGLSTKITKEEIITIKNKLGNASHLEEISIDNQSWQLLEWYEGESFRWTKSKEAKVFLKINSEGAGDLYLKYMNFIDSSIGMEPLILSVYANDELCGTMQCQLGVNEARLPLKNEYKAEEIVEVTLKTNYVWKPSDISESTDNRELGIAVYGVSAF